MKPKRIGQENLEFLNYGSHGDTQVWNGKLPNTLKIHFIVLQYEYVWLPLKNASYM